jgi:hypothetical protein
MEWDRNGPVHTSIMDSARAHCSPGEKRHARARTCGLATVRSSARSPLPECQERSTTHLRGQSTEALLAPGWSITSSRTPRISHISREIGWIHPTIIVNSSANHRRLLRFSRQTMETVRPGVGAASGSQRTARRRRSKSNPWPVPADSSTEKGQPPPCTKAFTRAETDLTVLSRRRPLIH